MLREIKSIETYITDIKNNVGELRFSKDNIVVEHRSNNPKRDFLFVNKVQGKHIPCKPKDTVRMCKSLASLINKSIENEKVLVVGFCETATAIANIIADNLDTDAYVIQTTREKIGNAGKQLLTFEEEHSHATTQNLMTYAESECSGKCGCNGSCGDNCKCKSRKSLNFNDYTYVLFIDDELSTGRTVLNFIKAFRETSSTKLKFGVASICNWQDDKNKEKFKAEGIEVFSLLCGKLISEDKKLFTDEDNVQLSDCKDYFNISNIEECDKTIPRVAMEGVTKLGTHGTLGEIGIFEYERLGHKAKADLTNMYNLFESFHKGITTNIRVIGTEEFMYWPIKIAEMLENKGYNVKVQNTTRSSIDVMTNSKGGITSKYKIPSVYDDDRITYLYNLDTLNKGDYVLFVTDSRLSDKANIAYTKLLNDIVGEGNYNIVTIVS